MGAAMISRLFGLLLVVSLVACSGLAETREADTKADAAQQASVATLNDEVTTPRQQLEAKDEQTAEQERQSAQLDRAAAGKPLRAIGSLVETASTLVLRGGLVAHTNGTHVDYITFQMANASDTGNAVEISKDSTTVSYFDASQAIADLPFIASNPATSSKRGWGVEWPSGKGPLLNPGERVEITVNLTGLSPRLGAKKVFTIGVKPSSGAVLLFQRTLPETLTAVVDLY